MDNLIHTSATHEEAEREIKLWFRPSDIPPLMRVFATQQSEEHFYYRDNRLFTTYKSGSVCLLAPGDVAWESDLNALRLIHQSLPAPCSLQTVIAKYLVNNANECGSIGI
jgi:nucleoside-diphosphate kinase